MRAVSPQGSATTLEHMTEPSHTVWEDEEEAREAALHDAGLEEDDAEDDAEDAADGDPAPTDS